jgi:hypothetical protein
MKVNPSEYEGEGKGGTIVGAVGAGRKLLYAIGYEYRVYNSKDCLRINFVCLKDFEDKNDEGNVITSNFFLTPKAIFRLGIFANRVGYNDEFDPMDSNSIERIMCMAPVVGNVEISKNGEFTNRSLSTELGKSNISCKKNGDLDFSDEQLQWIRNAEENWERLQAWGLKNRSDSSGRKPSSSPSVNHDLSDIPF